MTILITKQITRADWDAAGDKVVAAYDPRPEGFIAHLATETPTGASAIDIWASREHYDRFAAERFGPAIQAAAAELGVTFDGPTSVTFEEAFDVVLRL